MTWLQYASLIYIAIVVATLIIFFAFLFAFAIIIFVFVRMIVGELSVEFLVVLLMWFVAVSIMSFYMSMVLAGIISSRIIGTDPCIQVDEHTTFKFAYPVRNVIDRQDEDRYVDDFLHRSIVTMTNRWIRPWRNVNWRNWTIGLVRRFNYTDVVFTSSQVKFTVLDEMLAQLIKYCPSVESINVSGDNLINKMTAAVNLPQDLFLTMKHGSMETARILVGHKEQVRDRVYQTLNYMCPGWLARIAKKFGLRGIV
jgi:hypothetical protein